MQSLAALLLAFRYKKKENLLKTLWELLFSCLCYWFAFLWFRIEEKVHTKTVADVSREWINSLGEGFAWRNLG